MEEEGEGEGEWCACPTLRDRARLLYVGAVVKEVVHWMPATPLSEWSFGFCFVLCLFLVFRPSSRVLCLFFVVGRVVC
jgi:hypothetical protein